MHALLYLNVPDGNCIILNSYAVNSSVFYLFDSRVLVIKKSYRTSYLFNKLSENGSIALSVWVWSHCTQSTRHYAISSGIDMSKMSKLLVNLIIFSLSLLLNWNENYFKKRKTFLTDSLLLLILVHVINYDWLILFLVCTLFYL